MSVLDQLAARPLADVARALELELVDRSHLAPCPACGAERRSRSDDRRGPIHFGPEGWRCQACDARGTALHLVSYRLFGARLERGDPRWPELWQRCSSLGLVDLDHARAQGLQRPLPPLRPPPPAPPAPRPRPAGVAALWARCGRVDADPEVAAWLTSRSLAPQRVAELDLVRALPASDLPPWASYCGQPWSEGWRCVAPCFDATGRAVSLRARWTRAAAAPSGAAKASAASAGPGSAGACVLASRAARAGLRDGSLSRLVVVEGEPDWLTWATQRPDLAVIGLWSGAWTRDLAARIPGGCEVAVRVHHDDAGDSYARSIPTEDVLGLRASVRRSPAAEGDENDQLHAGTLPADPFADLERIRLVARDETTRVRLDHNEGTRLRAAIELGGRIEGTLAVVRCPRCSQPEARFALRPVGARIGAGCRCGWVGSLAVLLGGA